MNDFTGSTYNPVSFFFSCLFSLKATLFEYQIFLDLKGWLSITNPTLEDENENYICLFSL